DLAIVVDGEPVLFQALQEEDYVDADRVLCTKCSKTVARKKANEHSKACKGLLSRNGQQRGGMAREDGNNTGHDRKRPHSETEAASVIWEKLRGPVPSVMLKSTLTSLNVDAFHINGCPMVLSEEALELLRSLIPPEYEISKVLETDKMGQIDPNPIEEQFLESHEPVSEHLSVIASGGNEGLERLMGAVIVAGNNRFKITCAEIYSRDFDIDPHAERHDAVPSSVPTDELSTQYSNALKIVKVDDVGSNKKLVIGVRAYNYLITGGYCNGIIRIGPGRCAEGLEVNNKSKCFVKKERQDANLLSQDILSLGQLRSHFGHPFTYAGRRSALSGYGSVSVMPITIFTLSQFDVPFSSIFRRLAESAKSDKKKNVSLQLEDIIRPEEGDNSIPAQLTRALINMFPPGDSKLIITGNTDAEKMLGLLANHFSRVISDKNLAIQSRIARRIIS
ncbi:hypothetical protein BGZ49_004937, partial [Haplosporangium sp. Z 27]